MTVDRLIQELSLETLHLADKSRPVEGGYCGDLLSWVMGRARSGNAWVTIMTNVNVVAVAALTDVSCVVFAENVEVGEDVLDKAREQEITLLRSGLGSFELCGCIARLLDE